MRSLRSPSRSYRSSDILGCSCKCWALRNGREARKEARRLARTRGSSCRLLSLCSRRDTCTRRAPYTSRSRKLSRTPLRTRTWSHPVTRIQGNSCKHPARCKYPSRTVRYSSARIPRSRLTGSLGRRYIRSAPYISHSGKFARTWACKRTDRYLLRNRGCTCKRSARCSFHSRTVFRRSGCTMVSRHRCRSVDNPNCRYSGSVPCSARCDSHNLGCKPADNIICSRSTRSRRCTSIHSVSRKSHSCNRCCTGARTRIA